jgi:hypothetical protein
MFHGTSHKVNGLTILRSYPMENIEHEAFDRGVVDLERQVEYLKDTLSEVRELIKGYVDVEDGDYGVPQANKAMRAVQLIDSVL